MRKRVFRFRSPQIMCKISVGKFVVTTHALSSYDVMSKSKISIIMVCYNNLYSFSLQFTNSDGVEIESFTYSENVNVDEYQQLNELYNRISDVNYRISASEKRILDRQIDKT